MANIALNEEAQMNLNMEAMTENTEGHCDEWNVRHKQLLENDQYLNGEQEKIKEPEFTVADTRENIASKEKLPKILGKIARFFSDLKEVAFSGKYSDLSDKPAIVNNNTTTEAGHALDARQANPNIAGTLAATVAQLNNDFSTSNDVDFYAENIIYGSHFEPINDADRIRCIKYKNGMRVITGAVRCISEINDEDYMLFSVPANFARNPEYGRHGVQAWLAAVSTADGKSYNCIFYNDRISLWGSVFPKVGNILSIYIMY